jgi:hypothetical protein
MRSSMMRRPGIQEVARTRGRPRGHDPTPFGPRQPARLGPASAEASPDAALGYATGRYPVIRVPGDSVLSRGMYVTVWRRTPDGWRVVRDIGGVAPTDRVSEAAMQWLATQPACAAGT